MADMLAVWQAADEIELFESAWTFDHFYPIFTDDSTGPCLEGWITTTALAQATRRLRVGVLVTGMPYRHPAVLAKMAADPRHRLGRAARARDRRGLEPGRGGRLRDRPAPDPHRALRRVRRGVRGDHRPALQRADHVRTARYVQLENAVLQPEADPAAAPADLHRRRGRAAHAPLGGALRAALELPRRLGRAVRGQARRAAPPLRRARARPGRDHGLDAPAGRLGTPTSTSWSTRPSATATPASTSASCTCRPPHTPTCSTTLAARVARRSPADRPSSRRQRSSPRPCARRRWGRSGSASGRGWAPTSSRTARRSPRR